MANQDYPRNTLLPQPGQEKSFHFHSKPLLGEWVKEQLDRPVSRGAFASQTIDGYETSLDTSRSGRMTELQTALEQERRRIDASMREQGITPGQPVYENPRDREGTLLPT